MYCADELNSWVIDRFFHCQLVQQFLENPSVLQLLQGLFLYGDFILNVRRDWVSLCFNPGGGDFTWENKSKMRNKFSFMEFYLRGNRLWSRISRSWSDAEANSYLIAHVFVKFSNSIVSKIKCQMIKYYYFFQLIFTCKIANWLNSFLKFFSTTNGKKICFYFLYDKL